MFRAAIAGGMAGIVALPVFMFLVILRDAAATCPDRACIVGTVLSSDGLGLAAAGSAVFSLMGLFFVGPLTVPVGMLGAVLAVVLSGVGRDRSDDRRTAATEPPPAPSPRAPGGTSA